MGERREGGREGERAEIMTANRKWKWAVRTGSSRSGKVVYDKAGDYELPMNSGRLILTICLFVHERQLELGDYVIVCVLCEVLCRCITTYAY